MHLRFLSRLSAAPVALALAASLSGVVAAQDFNVTLNGTPLALSPAPIERAGRVFVPLRGVFQNLGASVVYANGVINAQGNGRAISLTVGSTQATVNGQPETLDVAPFIVGASTYVPLRFVSESLGATVNYDATNRIVALVSGQPPQGPPPQHGRPPQAGPPPQQAGFNGVRLLDVQPRPDSATRGSRPAISARFSQPVDVNSVKITLDGRDVSSTTYLNPGQFDFTPDYDLPAAQHDVHISGVDRDGAPFDRTFHFTSGLALQANFIRDLAPADGTPVARAFNVTGMTLPNSRVRIVATGGATLQGFIRLGNDTYTTDVTADGDGRFRADVPLQNQEGGNVVLSVQSTSPDGQSIVRRESLTSQ
jgi:hypothetical protein